METQRRQRGQRFDSDLALKTLIDSDQGVCPDGHPCHILVFVAGDLGRQCDTTHRVSDFEKPEKYVGWPLFRQDLTFEQITEYQNQPGADDELAKFAELYVADQQAIRELGEEQA